MSRAGPVTIVSQPIPVAARLARVIDDYAPGDSTPLHTHDRPQLLYAESGLMRLHTSAGDWVVPPNRAIWIPSGVPHQVVMRTAVAMRSLYLQPGAVEGAPAAPQVIAVSPLLRELVLEACRFPRGFAAGGPEDRLLTVLVDQLRFDDALPVHLPQPRSEAMAAVARAIEDGLADGTSLEDVARAAGFSLRHLARQFHAETGMPPGAWRQQLRMLRALELLAAGATVTFAGLEVGYQSPSAFIAAFRQHFGTSPTAYFASRP